MILLSTQKAARAVGRRTPSVCWRTVPKRPLATSTTSPATETPVGGFRGTLNGFLLGFGIVSAAGAAWVLKGQKQAAERVSATAAQLEQNTATLTLHLDKVHRLETELAVLKGVSVPRSEQQGKKDALDQLYHGLREDLDAAASRLARVETEVSNVMQRVPKQAPSEPKRIV